MSDLLYKHGPWRRGGGVSGHNILLEEGKKTKKGRTQNIWLQTDFDKVKEAKCTKVLCVSCVLHITPANEKQSNN
jgi:hypothetical protein